MGETKDTEDLIPAAKFTHDGSGRYQHELSSKEPGASHVCRRWVDVDSTQKMALLMALALVVVLLPLLIGLSCLVKSWTMGSEVFLVQIPTDGSDGDAAAQSGGTVAFLDECQAFTEERRYCGDSDQSWAVQADGSYVCTTRRLDPSTLKLSAPVATYPCKGNTPNADLSPNADGSPCVLSLSDASPMYSDLQDSLLLAGLTCWVSIVPGCVGSCWVYALLDRKSSSHCGCKCCVGLDYRSRGDRAAAATRLLAGWCLLATGCTICVTELFSLLSVSSLMEMTSVVEYSCEGAESSAMLDHVISLERRLWLQLGLRYTATIVACCFPMALEWANEGREISRGGVNVAP